MKIEQEEFVQRQPPETFELGSSLEVLSEDRMARAVGRRLPREQTNCRCRRAILLDQKNHDEPVCKKGGVQGIVRGTSGAVSAMEWQRRADAERSPLKPG